MTASTCGLIIIVLFFTLVYVTLSQFLGDQCVLPNNVRGRCVLLQNCSSAIDDVTKSIHPQICSFEGLEPIVCCKVSEEIVKNPESSIFGAKSRQYCKMAAQDKNVFAAVGGTPSLSQEFPHMAALGFGDQNDIKWYCGGSLISEDFVLTAAHCLRSREFGDVKWVRLGDLNLYSTTDDASPQDFYVTKKIPHPDYDVSFQYNDIALVQLDRRAEFNNYVKPICLHNKKAIPNVKPIATGWGDTQFGGQQSEVLIKVFLDFFSIDQCRKTYSQSLKRLPRGIDDETQVCAGGINKERDTCQGDSGGPLQFYDVGMLHLIGITSFGRACGIANSPGVYTRVSYFVPWIESIVWPN